MAIPTYEQIMRPFLEILLEGQSRTLPEVVNLVSDKLKLTLSAWLQSSREQNQLATRRLV